jgi:hypothetical protein
MTVTLAQCQARWKNGRACRNRAVQEGLCRQHAQAAAFANRRRRSQQYAERYGERFRTLLEDPELLNCKVELALFDQYLLEKGERLEDGVSGAKLVELAQLVETLRQALFVSPDAARVRTTFHSLERQVKDASERERCWQEILAAARERAKAANAAELVKAKREAVMTESAVAALLARMLEVVIGVVGPEQGRSIALRVDREIFGGAWIQGGLVASPEAHPGLPAGGEAVH